MQTEPERRGHAELQLFEAALLGLALARGWTPERHGSDEWGEHIEELFGLTAGRLVRVAQIEDDVFAEQVKTTVELRHGTVHHWLIYAGIVRAARARLRRNAPIFRYAATR
jgi:hypothetical protein